MVSRLLSFSPINRFTQLLHKNVKHVTKKVFLICKILPRKSKSFLKSYVIYFIIKH